LSDEPGRQKSGPRSEAIRLLTSAEELIGSSRDLVASSIARLVRSGRQATRPASAKRAPELLLDLLARPCELDLLIFFSRHPRALLTLDDLVSHVGYDIQQLSVARDVLRSAGLLTWSKSKLDDSAPAFRLYQLTPDTWDDVLPAFLWVATTAAGRRALRRALSETAGGSEISRAWPSPPHHRVGLCPWATAKSRQASWTPFRV
jgi:hypothetical protein